MIGNIYYNEGGNSGIIDMKLSIGIEIKKGYSCLYYLVYKPRNNCDSVILFSSLLFFLSSNTEQSLSVKAYGILQYLDLKYPLTALKSPGFIF